MPFRIMGFGAVTGAVGGAVSTVFFHTPSLNKTAMKIVGLGALQGALAQAAGWALFYYVNRNAQNGDEFSRKTFIAQLAGAAAITAGAMAVMGTTKKEAVANYIISSAVSWIVMGLIQ